MARFKFLGSKHVSEEYDIVRRCYKSLYQDSDCKKSVCVYIYNSSENSNDNSNNMKVIIAIIMVIGSVAGFAAHAMSCIGSTAQAISPDLPHAVRRLFDLPEFSGSTSLGGQLVSTRPKWHPVKGHLEVYMRVV